MSGTAQLVNEWETESFFTGAHITKRHYAVNPPLNGNDNIVVSYVEHSEYTGGPDLVVFKANEQGQETDFVNQLWPLDNDDDEARKTDDVAGALRDLGYEVTDNE